MDEKQINELLECSVCLDRMDQTCKVLPCQHTFCRRCLDEILLRKYELRCPECRALVPIPVADLPTNILVVRILEGLKTNGLRPLPHSSNGTGKPSAPARGVASSSFRRESPSSHLSRLGNQPCAKALYNYESTVSEDLTFKKGDIINLKRQIDDNWYQGELSGVIGHFPANFVQVLVPLAQVPQCKALFDFELKDEGEKDCLSFKKDEMLTVIRRVDENWLEGRKGDKIGIFPLVFVELNDAAKVLITKKSSRSILQQPTQQPSISPSSSITPVISLSARTTAITASVTETSSTPCIPQRSVSAPSGEGLFPTDPSIPGLVMVPHIVGCVVDGSATTTSQTDTQRDSSSVTGESLPAISVTLSDRSAASPSSPSSGPHAEQTSGFTSPEASSSEAVAASNEQSGAEQLSSPSRKPGSPVTQNKRHSYTPSTTSSPLPSPCGGFQQNRCSAEISMPPTQDPALTGLTPVSSTPSPSFSSTAASEALPSESAETRLKAAAPSPKHKISSSPTSAPSSEGSVESASPLAAPIYTAMYSYKPQKDDELELTKGEQYTVTEKCQDGWFKGSCVHTGRSGVFPGNYVHINRHSSAFKPVHANVLNIRAKVPHTPPPSYPGQESAMTALAMGGGGDIGQGPPPLLPRVAKLGSQGQRSKSPSGPLPFRSLSHPATSSLTAGPSRYDYPGAPFHPASPSSHLAGISVSSQPATVAPPSTSQSHHLSHWSSQPKPSLATIAAQPMPSLATISAQPMSGLESVSAMWASASINPPPNVVMSSSHHGAAFPEKEKKEKKEKEKKGLVKLFGGKGKKNKQAHPEQADHMSTMAVLCFDDVSHIRSGSYPAESSVKDTGSLVSSSHHRKAASFDVVNTIPPVPAKPRPKPAFRERYCCVVPYPPQTDRELCLELGDIIHVHRKSEDGWYKGTQERTGKTGMFPASFVEKL